MTTTNESEWDKPQFIIRTEIDTYDGHVNPSGFVFLYPHSRDAEIMMRLENITTRSGMLVRNSAGLSLPVTVDIPNGPIIDGWIEFNG